jgi:hypothetical protein
MVMAYMGKEMRTSRRMHTGDRTRVGGAQMDRKAAHMDKDACIGGGDGCSDGIYWQWSAHR